MKNKKKAKKKKREHAFIKVDEKKQEDNDGRIDIINHLLDNMPEQNNVHEDDCIDDNDSNGNSTAGIDENDDSTIDGCDDNDGNDSSKY